MLYLYIIISNGKRTVSDLCARDIVKKLNRSETRVILSIGDYGEAISPYDLCKKIDLSYTAVFNYCKAFETAGILSVKVEVGSRKSNKFLYSLTLRGLSYYMELKFIQHRKLVEYQKIDFNPDFNITDALSIMKNYSDIVPAFTPLNNAYETLMSKITINNIEREVKTGYSIGIVNAFEIFDSDFKDRYSITYLLFSNILECFELWDIDPDSEILPSDIIIETIVNEYKLNPDVWKEFLKDFQTEYYKTVFKLGVGKFVFEDEKIRKKISEIKSIYTKNN